MTKIITYNTYCISRLLSKIISPRWITKQTKEINCKHRSFNIGAEEWFLEGFLIVNILEKKSNTDLV